MLFKAVQELLQSVCVFEGEAFSCSESLQSISLPNLQTRQILDKHFQGQRIQILRKHTKVSTCEEAES